MQQRTANNNGHGRKFHQEYRINLLYLPMSIRKAFTAYRENLEGLIVAVDFHGLVGFIEEQFLVLKYNQLPLGESSGYVPAITHMNNKTFVHRFVVKRLAPELRKAILRKCIEERNGDATWKRIRLSVIVPKRKSGINPSTDYLYFLEHPTERSQQAKESIPNAKETMA
jgi:hypothetical protein